jgi:hypothetical protein
MGITAVLRRDIKKDTDLFSIPNVSAFPLQKIDYSLQYYKNLTLSYEPWDNVFEKRETTNGILATDEYKGFDPIEIMETTVTYQKDTVLFSKVFKTLVFQKFAHNNYYPEPYLVICPELELEGIGRTKEDALLDLRNLFDIYFNETRKISNSPQDHLEIIEAKINKSSEWKQDFYQLYNDLQKNSSIVSGNLIHHISIEE